MGQDDGFQKAPHPAHTFESRCAVSPESGISPPLCGSIRLLPKAAKISLHVFAMASATATASNWLLAGSGACTAAHSFSHSDLLPVRQTDERFRRDLSSVTIVRSVGVDGVASWFG